MGRTACRYCGGAIFWSETEMGRKIPLDTKQIKIMFSLEENDDGSPKRVKLVPGYRTHFETCTKYPGKKKHEEGSR